MEADLTLLEKLSNPSTQDYLFHHEGEDLTKFVLRGSALEGIPVAQLAMQLKSRSRSRFKLPRWYQTRGIVYPPSVNLEQCSSEITARFKSKLTQSLGVKRMADLSGGFGVDSFYFAEQSSVEYVEPDTWLMSLARHNHHLMGAALNYHNSNAEEYLKIVTETFDLIFVDPSRRNERQQKVHRLGDCEPNILSLQDRIFDKSKWLLVKASPLLDIQEAIRDLHHVKSVMVVSVENECKELLFLCERGYTEEPLIRCINLRSTEKDYSFAALQFFDFYFSEERSASSTLSRPTHYIYEPHAAIMKAGAFKLAGIRSRTQKVHTSTHLYTSHNWLKAFPGRQFRVLGSVVLDKKLPASFPHGFANILVRNHSLSVEAIKKKTGLKEGGELFLICGRDESQFFALMAERLDDGSF